MTFTVKFNTANKGSDLPRYPENCIKFFCVSHAGICIHDKSKETHSPKQTLEKG